MSSSRLQFLCLLVSGTPRSTIRHPLCRQAKRMINSCFQDCTALTRTATALSLQLALYAFRDLRLLCLCAFLYRQGGDWNIHCLLPLRHNMKYDSTLLSELRCLNSNSSCAPTRACAVPTLLVPSTEPATLSAATSAPSLGFKINNDVFDSRGLLQPSNA